MKYVKVGSKLFRLSDIVKVILQCVLYGIVIYWSLVGILACVYLLIHENDKLYSAMMLSVFAYAFWKSVIDFSRLGLSAYRIGGLKCEDEEDGKQTEDFR